MRDEDYKSYGAYLKNLRTKKELTVEELAEKLNIKIETIKRWEKNLEIPELDDIYKLSEFYEIPSEHLLRLKDELFKPNLKAVCFIANVLGVTITTARILFYAVLVLALIAACTFFKSAADQTTERISSEEEQWKRAEVRNYLESQK